MANSQVQQLQMALAQLMGQTAKHVPPVIGSREKITGTATILDNAKRDITKTKGAVSAQLTGAQGARAVVDNIAIAETAAAKARDLLAQARTEVGSVISGLANAERELGMMIARARNL